MLVFLLGFSLLCMMKKYLLYTQCYQKDDENVREATMWFFMSAPYS